MAIDALLETLASFEQAVDITSRIQLLARLKSEAIGHVEKKELLVVHGILDTLCHLLQSQAKSRGKQPSQSNGLQNGHPKIPRPWTQEDELTLQSVLLLTSLANEGPAFVTPMLAGDTIRILVSLVSPAESSRSKITVAALKALKAVATAHRLTNPTQESFVTSASSDILYTKAAVQDIALILADKSHAPIVQTKISLVCQLINITCTSDQRRGILLDGGVLDLLAARLAAYRIYEAGSPTKFAKFPAAALLSPTSLTLGHVFGALMSIVEDSQYRAVRLLYAPTVNGCFPFTKSNNAYDHSFNAQNLNALEALLPNIQHQKLETTSSSSKAISPLAALNKPTDSMQFNAWTRDNESAMIPWLFHCVKSHRGLTRVQAAHLLAEFARLDLLSPVRERLLAWLAFPVLASSDDTFASNDPDGSHFDEGSIDRQYAKELTRFVLAKPISQKNNLQVSANDVYANKQVCQAMKDSFEPLHTIASVWTPSAGGDGIRSVQHLPPTRTLGMAGLRPELASMYKEREGALKLLAAIASTDDDRRKYFTENGITPYIIDSMKPFDQQALQAAEKSEPGSRRTKIQVTELGNPDSVLIAACGAALSLSRSVALMRTSLIDAGIVKPVLALLKHPNVEVLKAATDVVCNIDVEFSPMRQDLVEGGATKILCEHAHSADAEIRLRSLWALKHLVMQLPLEIKTSCLEELGSGWVVQIINGNVGAEPFERSLPNSASSSIPAANAAGEQINILNTSEVAMNDPQDTPIGQEPWSSLASSGEEIAMKLISPGTTSNGLSNLTVDERTIRTKAIEEAQWRQILIPKQTEEKIQVQALDFIRNSMLCPSNAEMIDYYFQTLGASCLFDIVADKLKSTPMIANSAIMILTHIAASVHRHRQQIMSQPGILQSLLHMISTGPTIIRRSICLLLSNLTWTDESTDIAPAKLRAVELRKLGFEEALKSIRHEEGVDLKERARTAFEQLANLLEGSNGNVSSSTR